ncbi:hypothetical protein [Aeromonas simiae]|uniref:Uncharacterized protein n=1 Tax=Aeromonas simiae TaxID=218936 RepID=A0A5J6WZT7_9GAMM|nr:hypothetical protein [Aeromonas simiae]QFI55834.1 hypothetical protein FE240_14760 [Aeromonas simiae]
MAIYDNGIDVSVLKKLDDKIFVDYLWYRTGEINNSKVMSTPHRDLLEKSLKDACTTPRAQHFMREHNPRDNRNFGLERFIDALADKFALNCLTEEYYKWLHEDNTRLKFFIWRLMSHIYVKENDGPLLGKTYNFIPHPAILTDNLKTCAKIDAIRSGNITKKDIISTINRIPCNKIEKEGLVQNILKHAESAMKNNEILLWFEKDYKEKVVWLCNYLEHNNSNYIPLVINGSSMQRDDLISFFDVLSFINVYQYKLLVSNMKKAWSQKAYRDKNSNKKQYSINMSKDIGDILDKLSLAQNENKNTIVEALIRAEYEKIARI